MKHPFNTNGNPVKQKKWREEHPGYYLRWRKIHPGYVNKNRKAQRRRDAKKRGFLAKPNEWSGFCIERLREIRTLNHLAKPNDSIDHLCRYLLDEKRLAKPNEWGGMVGLLQNT
ncbi:MAG: hypothetical protein HYT97_03530 [Elusimicrobia bacterium]|nr:hypothetical protein [Elusimicrobiota bacterium]